MPSFFCRARQKSDCCREAFSFEIAECVLKAVNLGSDTDTTAAVAGGLAGLCYGYYNIPDRWISQLARQEDIEDLAVRLAARI
ncbi:MAG: ADP-ribosylglycohydrolase family protein [Prevotellaceae bacterium]|nr:ADP-ribosylglycohydrolase family protein [Prevotellaceae bacterium]